MLLKLPRCKEKCERGSLSTSEDFFAVRLAISAIALRVAGKIACLLVAMLAGKRGYLTAHGFAHHTILPMQQSV